MNAQVQLLTTMPEQLKDFEQNKHSIIDNLLRIQITFDQLAELFTVLEDLSESVSNEEWKSQRILRLSGIGMSTCENWSDVASKLQDQISNLSPLNTAKA